MFNDFNITTAGKKKKKNYFKQIHLNFLSKLERKRFSGSREKIFGPTNFFS